jgi:hypothetical protein
LKIVTGKLAIGWFRLDVPELVVQSREQQRRSFHHSTGHRQQIPVTPERAERR